MPTKSGETAVSGESPAVDEAIRALSETPRRKTAENRPFVRAWASGVEGLITAGIDIQNAWLASAPRLLESTFAAQTSALAAWTAAIEQYQQAMLGTWRRIAVDMEKRVTPSTRGEHRQSAE